MNGKIYNNKFPNIQSNTEEICLFIYSVNTMNQPVVKIRNCFLYISVSNQCSNKILAWIRIQQIPGSGSGLSEYRFETLFFYYNPRFNLEDSSKLDQHWNFFYKIYNNKFLNIQSNTEEIHLFIYSVNTMNQLVVKIRNCFLYISVSNQCSNKNLGLDPDSENTWIRIRIKWIPGTDWKHFFYYNPRFNLEDSS